MTNLVSKSIIERVISAIKVRLSVQHSWDMLVSWGTRGREKGGRSPSPFPTCLSSASWHHCRWVTRNRSYKTVGNGTTAKRPCLRNRVFGASWPCICPCHARGADLTKCISHMRKLELSRVLGLGAGHRAAAWILIHRGLATPAPH